ncbi:hypothetical protein M407DRAFT_17275 [Tulasnella calospora MUT 4182]|uniref:UBC core domain-containing protein n=1 Tax=Tulasnella calospora MUT 4182 TaxID=1051891 RepID=A0A0C3MJX7_9AGAM|nr:hypothetical protein M407DRAFT_17275 [Tulasnella calospora MUT 4182]
MSEVQQLVEMGATAAQARAALKKSKNDVMQAAEMIFAGEFDSVTEDADTNMQSRSTSPQRRVVRPITPEDEEDDSNDDAEGSDAPMDEDDDDEEGIFFSKSRREEVVEVDEELEYVQNAALGQKLPILTRGDWMRGCPEASEQTHLFSLYNKASEPSRKCNACNTVIPISKADLLTIYPNFELYTDSLRAHVVRKCAKCKQEVCLACGEIVSDADKNRASHQPKYDPLFHCADLQGLLLGMGLYMIDNVYASEMLGTGGADGTDSGRAAKKRRVDTSADDGHSSGNLLSNMFGGNTTVSAGKKKSGIGYDGAVKEDMSGQTEALAAQQARDTRIGTLMSQVRAFLPSLQRTGGSQTTDYLVSPTALAHLRRRFNTVASSLLRNDSLTDMSDRSVLYFELFSWLETISKHEALASMVAMPIMIPCSSTVNNMGSSGQKRYRERTVVYEGSSGPRELMESLVIQATAAKKGLEGDRPREDPNKEEEMTEEQKRVTNATPRSDKGKVREKNPHTEENRKLLTFCDKILETARYIDRSLRETKGDAFVERMYQSLPRIPSKARPNIVASGDASTSQFDSMSYAAGDAAVPKVTAESSEEEIKKVYEEWATNARFEYCDLSIQPSAAVVEARQRRAEEQGLTAPQSLAPTDDAPSYMSAFNQEARMLTHSDIPKRNLAIAKELAVLTTNLPVAWNSSIFLRVDETRVDIIKALITGPEGTPYHNGCYLFDIFLGPSYNTAPPSVKYMTTNTGKFRFNPNLYAEGKVCLSLLGTWAGPGWVAGRSTLLQVLISIQSMILCEEPYLNEPGWANGAGSSSSISYSANVRRMVVHTAMLGNLKNPPEPFKDIILTHFRLKAKTITAQLDDWLTKDDGRPLSPLGTGYVSSNSSGTNGNGGSGNGFRRDVEELKRLLDGLTRGEDPTVQPGSSGSAIPTPATGTPSEIGAGTETEGL